MALHFVTSAQAEDHIYSSDDARKTEGMIGSGGFVLGVKNKLSASMIDANTLRILEGDIIFCGRHVNINNYEEVTIQNGTPGMNSIALVVLSLKTDPSEEATIKVYEGEETEGDPVTPEYIQGDLNNGDTEAEMPLYTITKTGLSVGDPVAQFEVWVSEKEFRDSVSQDIDSVSQDISSLSNNVSSLSSKVGRVQLWSGSWSSGSITVSGLSDYFLFACDIDGGAARPIGISGSSWTTFRLGAAMLTSTPRPYIYQVYATRSGNRLTLNTTMTKGIRTDDPDTTVGITVTAIYGLVPY